MPRTALIIIDMQRGSFTAATPRFDANGLVQRLNALAEQFRKRSQPVIYVQHCGAEDDVHHPSQTGFQLLPALAIENGDIIVRKTSCDAFLQTSLSDELERTKVERLTIGGCATDYCVDTTVRSALARGFPTVVPSDGHTTADRAHLAAEKIIEHHNSIWSDFLSPAGPATICPCAKVPDHLWARTEADRAGGAPRA